MNSHARNIEPDLGPLLEMTDDLSDQDALGNSRTEPSLDGRDRKKASSAFGPMERIGSAPTTSVAERKSIRRDTAPAISSGSAILSAWGGFWRAVVIGVVSGTVGGVVGAFTLVWLTGAGWTVFAKLLIDAIGRL